MCYEIFLVKEQEGRQRLARFDEIANLYNSTNQFIELRTLHCSEYFHKFSQTRFGLVFDFPDFSPTNRGQGEREVFTLRHVFKPTGIQKSVPHFGDRFKLASKLATFIANFHKGN